MKPIFLKTIIRIKEETPFKTVPLKTICRNGFPMFPVTHYLGELQDNRSAKTLLSYTNHLLMFFRWLHQKDIDFEDISVKVLKSYLNYLKARTKGVSEAKNNMANTTVYMYFSTVIRFIEWCLAPQDQEKLLKKTKNPIRRGGMLKGFKGIYEVSILKDLLPATGKSLPKFITATEAQKVRSWIRDTYEDDLDFPIRSLYLCCFELLIGSGIRKGELLSLQLDCLKTTTKIEGNGKKVQKYALKLPDMKELETLYGEDLLLKIGAHLKTGSREIPITSNTASVIQRWKARRPVEARFHNFLLANVQYERLGRYFTVGALETLFDNINNKLHGAELNQNLTPHVCRHSYATVLTNLGMPLDSIQQLLGHASIESTQIYTHLDGSVVRTFLEENAWGKTTFFGGI